MRKQNYLNNKDILKEIHKSKLSFCYVLDEDYSRFDTIVENIDDVKKIFLHQANEKLDEAVLKYFYKQYNKEIPKNIMPISVDIYGNSSVATIPTLYDIVLKTNFKGHNLKKGDVILFASVGAGMNINALTYQL